MSTIRVVQLLIVTSSMAMNAENAQQPSFVPGQVLARFLEGTPQREVIEHVSQTVPLDLSGLDNVIDALSERAGVPLRVHRLGSGYWLTFAVDRSALSIQVESLLTSQDGVDTVAQTMVAGPDSTVQFIVSARDGSRLGRLVERKNQRNLSELMKTWSAAGGVQFEHTVDNDHLVITIDWNATTLALVERFKAFPEIEAAQPNYRMGMGAPL